MYWKLLVKFNYTYKKSRVLKRSDEQPKLSKYELAEHLKSMGIKSGDCIIVHSSYDYFKNSGLTPTDIINTLIDVVGIDGTILMPASPQFSNQSTARDYLTTIENQTYKYSPRRTPHKTGILSYFLQRRDGAIRSLHPINTVVCYGASCSKLVSDTITAEDLPCGINSPWYKAIQLNSKIIALGVDLVHSLTSIHVNEDCNPNWPIKDWYHTKSFEIEVEPKNFEKYSLKERAPKWGALHFAERKLHKDLTDCDLILSSSLKGYSFELIESVSLYNFLDSKRTPYPYFYIK